VYVPPICRLTGHGLRGVISHKIVQKSKTIPVAGRGAHRVQTSRLPTFVDIRFTHGGEDVSLRDGRPLPTGRFLRLISVRGCIETRAIVRLEGID
jgi:hypothetical protein